MKKILMIFGTRPEAIKMAPVYLELCRKPGEFDVRVCVTAQHRQMLDQVLELFQIKTHYDLNIMKDRQDLFDVTSAVLLGLKPILQEWRPDLLLVHGDTTTTLAASIAGFYEKIPVGHVEAGLRTGNLNAPWPEEFNRRVASIVTAFHFAPTESAKQNLLREAVPSSSIYVTGNTVIDALLTTSKHIENDPDLRTKLHQQFPYFNHSRKIILLTGHRRENFGAGFENIFSAIRDIIFAHPEVDVVYPVHLNPNVRQPATQLLSKEIDENRVFLIEPQDYLSFVFLMKNSDLIITDSGGVQEEAPTFGVPVLVTRDVTERPEAVAAGCVSLVGNAIDVITQQTKALLKRQNTVKITNPYGDGLAAGRIREIILERFGTGATYNVL